MSVKLTDEQIIKRAEIYHANYDILKIWRTSEDKHRIWLNIKCDKGHIYDVIWDNFKKVGCPECANILKSEKERKYNYEELYNILLKRGLKIITPLEGIRKSSIECECLFCGKRKKGNITAFVNGRECSCVQIKKHTKTQEIFKKEVFDLVGNEYEVVSDYINNNTHVKIKHNSTKCNNSVFSILPRDFLYDNGRCKVCCKSKAEIVINKLLKKYNIEFEEQKEFEGLIGIGKGNLSYDFFIPTLNLLIEYQGEYHYKKIHRYHDYNRQIEHDKRKLEFAVKNKIKLLQIPYWDYDNIENILKKELNLGENIV